MTAPSAAELIRIATAEVGVHEGKKGGSWDNIQKYSEELPGFSWSDGQPWCDTFVGWCFWKDGLTEAQAPRSASCDASAAAWKKMGRYSEYPAIGAQVLFGVPGNMQHTGIVTGYDDTYVRTVEGNTNSTGSYQGDGVYAKIHERRDPRVIGYGYPDFPEGIVSADPAWQNPKATGLHVHGADISHYQGGALGIETAMHAGLRWMYHKATEGTGYTDPNYARRRIEIGAVRATWFQKVFRRRCRFGAYHFATPHTGDAVAQAQHFLAVAQPKAGDMAPMLDLEQDGGLSRRQLTSWVRTWARVVEQATGRKPIIYTHFDLDDTCGCLLWVARYNNADAAPKVPAPWTGWDVWQFSDGQYGTPNQLPGLGHVDLDTMRKGLRVRQLMIRGHRTPNPPPPPPPPAPKPPVTIRHAHSSGRFDRSPASLHAEVLALSADADLITVTEVNAEPRGKALAEKGWDHYRGPNTPGADECAILWNASVSRLVAADSVQVTDLTYDQTNGHQMAPVHVAVAVLEDIATARTTLVTDGHYPSDVQGTSGPEGIWNSAVARRVAAHKSAVAGTLKLVEEWAAKYQPDEVMICGDWNLNIANAKVRAWFAGQFPGYVPNWPVKPTGRGTLGHRWIDVAFLRGLEVTAGPVVHTTDASDHRYYVQTLASS